MKSKLFLIKIFLILIFSLLPKFIYSQPDGVYRIKLMTVGKESDLRIFNNLKDLGTIIIEPFENNMLRVYLGNYVGKPTADKILPTILQRGFKGAFVEKSSASFTTPEGDTLTHTMQFIALKKLDIRTIINNPKLSESDKREVFIWYHNGFYRVSLGLINENQTARIENYKAKSLGLGFKSFTQKFAGVAPVAEAPKVQTNKKTIPTIPSVKKLEKKDAFEKELKKASTPKSSTTPTNAELDPILVPKEAKINPNAKLKPIK
jgi:hypothetical protein